MVLNYIWIAFFFIAFVVALARLCIGGDTAVFTDIINASFASAKTGFEVSLGLTGILSLWLGIMAVMQGADEVDTVMNLGNFMEENYEAISDELEEIKESAHDAKLKIILETGALATPENISKAAILAAYCGADFIKTSTGKGYPGASTEAAYIICKVIKQYYTLTHRKVGIKVSGGIRTAEEAVKYYTIVKEVLGNEWLNKDLFRIGASSLVGDIEHRLGE